MNSSSKVTINFYGLTLPNIIDHNVKKNLLNQIKDLTGKHATDKWYENIGNKSDDFFTQNTSLVYSLMCSNEKYWVYLTRINGIKQCIFVSNYLKNGYPYPKILNFSTVIEFSDEFYNNTLMKCEILNEANFYDNEDNTNRIVLLFSDLIVQSEKSMINVHPYVRISNLVNIINNHKIHLQNIEKNEDFRMAIQVKKFFTNNSLQKMISFSRALPYKVKGILVFSCMTQYETPRVWIDKYEMLIHHKRKSTAKSVGNGVSSGPHR